MISLPSAKNSHSAKIGEGLRLRLGKGAEPGEKKFTSDRITEARPGIKGCKSCQRSRGRVQMCHVLWCHCWRSCSSYPRAQIVIGLPRVLVLTPILDGFTVNYAQRWNANKDGSSGLPKVFLGVSNPCSPLFLSFPFPTFSPFPCAPFCDEFNAFCLKTEAIFHWPSGGVSSEIASVSVMPAWTGKCVHPWRLGSKKSKEYPARLGPGFLGHCRIKPNLWQSNANSHAD